jgi:hypothetical protein
VNDALYLLVGLFVLVLVVFNGKIRSRARRAGRDAGTRAGQKYADGKLPGALQAMGTTLVLETSAAAAAQVVDSAVATKPKRFQKVADGTYTAKFAEADDVHVRLEPAGSGTRLQVESFRDYMQFPQGRKEWDDLQERVTAAAADAGVPVTEGEVLTYERRDQVEPNNWRWRRVGS